MKTTGNDPRVGVIGVGHMGRHHVRIIAELQGVELAGLLDTDSERAQQFCTQYGCRQFETIDEVLNEVDALIVAAPTSEHLRIGEKILRAGKHLMMEKPLADTAQSAQRLVDLAEKESVVLMVGHVERYNPAIQKMMELIRSQDEEIVSIDCRRLSPFDGSRCLDVDVLYDLLIHDVDLALEIADAPIIRVSASGRPVFSDRTDVVHARIEFANRACAVFWAGKCSPEKVRCITVTTPSRYIQADTIGNSLTVHTAERLPALDQGVCFMGEIRAETIPVEHKEPLRAELEDFLGAINGDHTPLVDGKRALRGVRALDLIADAIRENRRQGPIG